jgi:hypothetical protein
MTKPNALTHKILDIVRQHQADQVALTEHHAQVSRDIASLLGQNITAILAQQLFATDLEQRVQQLEADKVNLQNTVANLQRERVRLQDVIGEAENERDLSRFSLSEVALHLARLCNLQTGSEDELRVQFRMKGLQDTAIDQIIGSTGFLEEVGRFAGPRLSRRLGLKDSRSPGAAEIQ